MTGAEIYQWCQDLFPINRSLTGEGNRETLAYLKRLLPDLHIKSFKSGSKVFDWTIPKEWKVRCAYIKAPCGKKLCDFSENNLHLVGYSQAINQRMSLTELKSHLHTLPDQPNAIPYVTSYYADNWGFCLTHDMLLSLEEGEYEVVIDTEHFDGVLNYGELIIPGDSEEEILLSTYICHPSMANNELSGPTVTAAISQSLLAKPSRKYSYRVLFLAETIGSIAYLSEHIESMQKNTVAGFVVTCTGDDRCYSFMPSRQGESLADRAAKHVLSHIKTKPVKYYSFLQRGSDERQYCAPLVDLPVCSIMRSKYAEYPEYHTSLDDLTLISEEGLFGAYKAILSAIELIEANDTYCVTTACEPQLGKRGLYPNISSTTADYKSVENLMNFLAYADGTLDLIALAERIDANALELIPIAQKMLAHNLVEKV